ncbi:uridine diphosphate-N-acetylglucosamine-binding protein YvcK [Mannheimia sp. AT1]|uniref:Putative gluconeogenesis factor n=1 Tax=Mannheimia cairinae TaxID=3025936 RepID=A0ABT5MV91_9PAST|nr:uridine diphosphate-N-acetylglucosamine-binding protein YvcK [Mannheimia cairinae]MDD0824827.1 uridine diphosphate-N-acetylglucosamine-binding protein YvcK [Mannheimia cairinae]MDD0826243.1 uridine diphosphate-N-acetylglucosamine-binding protein YvcK [Mannheimia cairinae]
MSEYKKPRHSNLNQLNSVVALGGGHGLGRLLSALAFLKERLTGIVATTDNGGSTGRIRSQQGGIAWGDLRNCLNQIIAKPTVASNLFEYRFGGSGELEGHNLGNLILTALENMQIRPLEGINLVRDLLRVKSKLIPMSEMPVHLIAQLTSGKSVFGEVAIDALNEVPNSLLLDTNVLATPEAIITLREAELILLGPGSFFTSIMPNLLVAGIAQAITESSAQVIFIDNIGQEHGPAGELSLNQRIQWIENCIGQSRVNAVITTDEEQAILPANINVLRQNLSAEDVYYRHDRNKLSKAIDSLIIV